ncbi:DUF6609 family protein [Kribbella sp. CA-293567]|uniref:DUF6609 family protein n=1 Tax=Kribbella sp. CA-293567 TaxID=3002436 RepID=UPI0022DCE8D5|nr:DUF6609 family protein [Kribbella sp. CA-293567]WBQ03290.1 hypothetical protein OX958_25330 [Kribbella sp. CA-293567]
MDVLTDFDGMARTFPLMRGGGALLVLVGLGLVVGGAAGRRWMLPGLISGAALAVLVMMVGGITKTIFEGLGYPAIYQYVAFGIGVVAEVGLVNLVVAKVPDRDSRRFWLWILLVVGVHFLVLAFSHGPICGLLGLLCIVNAGLGLLVPGLPYRVLWVADGVLKVAAGAAMVSLSY